MSRKVGEFQLAYTESEKKASINAYLGTCIALYQQLIAGDFLAVYEEDTIKIFIPSITWRDAVRQITELYKNNADYQRTPVIAVLQQITGQLVHDY